jgi:hypothetical protein
MPYDYEFKDLGGGERWWSDETEVKRGYEIETDPDFEPDYSGLEDRCSHD